MYIIANSGSFAEQLLETLSARIHIDGVYLVNRSTDSTCILLEVLRWLESCDIKLSSLLFVGGEVRDSGRMIFMNYTLPLFVYTHARNNSCAFIYFSSLSVFGLPYSRLVSTLAARKPLDSYGKSKKMLDDTLAFDNHPIAVIYPASIVTSVRPGVLLSFANFINRYFLVNLFFRFFTLPGALSVCTVDMLALTIADVSKRLSCSSGNIQVICSRPVLLSGFNNFVDEHGLVVPKIPSGFIKLPSIPLEISKTLTYGLPYSLRRRLIFLFSSILYQ